MIQRGVGKDSRNFEQRNAQVGKLCPTREPPQSGSLPFSQAQGAQALRC
jgi:hypothetical protein